MPGQWKAPYDVREGRDDDGLLIRLPYRGTHAAKGSKAVFVFVDQQVPVPHAESAVPCKSPSQISPDEQTITFRSLPVEVRVKIWGMAVDNEIKPYVPREMARAQNYPCGYSGQPGRFPSKAMFSTLNSLLRTSSGVHAELMQHVVPFLTWKFFNLPDFVEFVSATHTSKLYNQIRHLHIDLSDQDVADAYGVIGKRANSPAKLGYNSFTDKLARHYIKALSLRTLSFGLGGTASKGRWDNTCTHTESSQGQHYRTILTAIAENKGISWGWSAEATESVFVQGPWQDPVSTKEEWLQMVGMDPFTFADVKVAESWVVDLRSGQTCPGGAVLQVIPY